MKVFTYLSWDKIATVVSDIGRYARKLGPVDAVVGLLAGGSPLATLLAKELNTDLAFARVRRSCGCHGDAEQLTIDVPNLSGMRVLIADDSIETGDTMEEAIREFEAKGCTVAGCVALAHWCDASLSRAFYAPVEYQELLIMPWNRREIAARGILVLEDDPARLARFDKMFPGYVHARWPHDVITHLSNGNHWPLLFLDHDLEGPGGSVYCDSARNDTGMEVVRQLEKTLVSIGGIFIHSCNTEAAIEMQERLTKAGYNVDRCEFDYWGWHNPVWIAS